MLRANPHGGRPIGKLGKIDWDSSYPGFQYKLGYCECGKKVLATPDELTEIVNTFEYLIERERVIKRLAIYLLKKLS